MIRRNRNDGSSDSDAESWTQIVCSGAGSSGQIVGERGGTAFPFRFWRGNAIPLAYTTAVGGCGGTWRTPASTPSYFKSCIL